MIGERIDGRYNVLRVIGQGGMGAVYEAQHLGTGRRVAVKVIRAQMAESSEMVQRFHREARAAGSIETPHIVQVLDTGTDRATGVVYMVMELLQGEDLQHLLKRCGRLSPELSLRLIGQACIGLDKAHQAGVVHRDIKPANLFLSEQGSGQIVVKVVDFGIAKTIDVEGSEDASLTRTGGLVGSPLYVSPEQAMGRKTIDQRSDVWSLGVVLYQALCGRVPRPKTDTVVALMMGICTEPAPPIQDFAPWVPPEVALLVQRMLAINPAARLPSVAAVLETIGPWLPRGLSIHAHELVALPQALEAHVADRAALDADAVTLRESREPVAMGGSATPAHPGTPHASVRAQAPALPDVPQSGAREQAPAILALPAPGATTSGDSVLSVSQTGLPPGLRRSPLRPLLALSVVLGAGGVLAYGLVAQSPEAALAGALSASASVQPVPPPPAPPEEHTARLAVDPPDAKVTVDGNETPTRSGGVELRGGLGSVHHVRLEKGAQQVDGDVAITSMGAVPSHLRMDLAAPSPLPRPASDPRPPPRASSAPSSTAKLAGKPRAPEPDRNFE